MTQKTLRILLGVNLSSFVLLLVTFGSPFHHFPGENIVANWWVFSSAAVFVLFIAEAVMRLRRRTFTGFWIDAILLGAWVCALTVMLAVAISNFGGF